MGKLLNVLLFAFLVQAKGMFAQDNQNIEVNYLDSTLYYLQQCQTAKGVDSVTFYQAIEFLSQTELNAKLIDQIEEVYNQFKRQNYIYFANEIDYVFILKITNSDSTDFAIRYCQNIIHKYDSDRNPEVRFKALTALIEIRKPLRAKSIPGTFDFYAARLKVYLEKNDSSGLSISYFCIGSTYRLVGLTDMAIYNFKKSLSYINKADTLTNLQISGLGGWINNISVLGQLYLEVGDYETAISMSQMAKFIRLKIPNEFNVSFLNGNIALAKLHLNRVDSVYELLNSAIPMAIKGHDYPSLARTYEILGQYFIALNQLDSAEANLAKCKEVLRAYSLSHWGPAGVHTPNYYLAELRIKQNRYKEAKALLEAEIPNIKKVKKELLKEQKLLIEVCLKLGDSEAADSTFKKYIELQSLINAEERKNRTKSFEVEAKIEEAEATIENLVFEKELADITKKYLIGIAIILLVVASIILNRFRVTRRQKKIIEKEKQRSEALLLNILPEEVAEELKAKGSAEARQFEEVTVMFTDFKGFTQISERLTPAELVSEIDACFKAFDQIVTAYGIEKIKTIGDAYMCVGGLPVPNKTHAIDIVNAALDIQKFMEEHYELRKKTSEEVFEIRIGIHTGPVVAGIVGVKKFAYDIWGDTVNIAARMESSGEPWKVNISSATYALVKDTFKCVHRGKIQAKNKGEIDMYFVEGII